MKKPETESTPSSSPLRGKYANLLKQGSNVVILDPVLLQHFPDSESVNRALHAFLAINDQVQLAGTPIRTRRRPSPAEADFDPRIGTRTTSASR